MIDFDFCGFASLPGHLLGECLDAAGLDIGVDDHAGAPASPIPVGLDESHAH